MKLRTVLLLALSLVCAVHGQDEDCDSDDYDPVELAKLDIFQTSVLESEGLKEDVVKKQIDGTITNEIAELSKAQDRLRAEVESGGESLDYTPPVLSSGASAKYLAQEIAYYRPVCPYRYYWLSRYRWFFLTTSGGNRKYCWAYYSTYATSCLNRYCNWWYKYPYSWYHYYRCVPRYTYIWIYARCATYLNNTWVWSSQYIRVPIPRGCSCKRYFNPILVARQCPAANSQLLD